MTMRLSVFIPFLGFALLMGVSARAETDSDREAKAAFVRGKELFHSKEYSEAAEAFREANRIKPSWKILYNIGQSEAAAKQYGLALESFESYVVKGGDEIELERQEEVQREIARLKGLVGYLAVSAPKSAKVWINQRERGTAPLPGKIRVVAGVVHRLVIRLNDEVLIERSIRVGSGETLAILAERADEKTEPVEEPSAKEPIESESQPEAIDHGPSWLSPTGWSLLGIGAAALIAGTVTGSVTMAMADDIKNVCKDNGDVCPDSEKDDADKAENLALATDILLPIGGVLAAAGIVMVVVEKTKFSSESPAPVAFRPGLFSLSLEARF
jgi:tetratricopeptide (TPR) repeat protein